MDTLNLSKSQIEQKVGLFLGWGRGEDGGETAWTDRKAAIIRDAVESGLRRFYYPIPPYQWSFLKPYISLTLASGARTITLPADFSWPQGDITVTDASSNVLQPIKTVNPTLIDQLYVQNTDQTGFPQYASLRWLKGTDPLQKQELYIFPQADAAYTLRVQYAVNPKFLDGTHPYAYGGAEHAETILESCYAVAEERLNDMTGLHAMAFQQRLAASMAMDARRKEQWVGYNGDDSDNRNILLKTLPAVTYGGVEYN